MEFIFNGFERTSLASRSFYRRIRHLFINRSCILLIKVPRTANLCIRTEPISDLVKLMYRAVLLNQIFPSKDNELRLSKAVRSPQHQEQVSRSTVVRLVFAMIKIVISSVTMYEN